MDEIILIFFCIKSVNFFSVKMIRRYVTTIVYEFVPGALIHCTSEV